MTKGVGLAVLLLLILPLVGAEQVQHEVFVDQDGDVALSTQDGTVSQQDATGFYKNVDVVGGGVWAETDDTVTFYIEVDDLTADSQVPLPFSDPDYYFYFDYGDQTYRIMVITALENPFNGVFGREGEVRGSLEQQVGDFSFRGIAGATIEMDYSEEKVLVSVPRGAIVDENQAPLARNSTLSNIWMESKSMGWFGFPLFFGSPNGQASYVGIPQANDFAPDSAVGKYVMTTGSIVQSGSVFAFSDDPIRWTNGEATTLTFQSRVTNVGKSDITLDVAVQDAGNGWEMAYSNIITVPAASSVNHTVLATIPFGHQHGVTKMFKVNYASSDGDHTATSVLGVHWPEIPQPAGHHNKLWLHSAAFEVTPPFDALFSGTSAWFSAKDDLDHDEQVPIAPDFTAMPGFFGAQEGRAVWMMSLEPALRMGLDFQPGVNGLIEAGFQVPVPMVDAQLEVTLLHSKTVGQNDGGFGRGGPQRVTEPLMQATSEVIPGVVSGGIDFELALVPESGLGPIPYEADANLMLMFDLQATFMFGAPGASQESLLPTLDPKTTFMQLPLNEYHDPNDLVFQTDDAIQIVVGEQGQERFVNPGNTVVYTFELQYDGTPTGFSATLSGANGAWGRIIGDTVFDLDVTTRQLAVAVTAPEGARDGERADITLTVQSVQNAAIQAGVNMITTVTTSEEIPDESDYEQDLAGELTKKEDAPGLPLMFMLLALIFLARRN